MRIRLKQFQAVSVICFTFISDDGLKYSCSILHVKEMTGDDMDRMHSITTHYSIAHIVFNICHFVTPSTTERFATCRRQVEAVEFELCAYSAVCGRTSALRLLLSAAALAPLIAVK